MITVTPYLMFNGQCEEALKFYALVFGGEILRTERYSSMPGEIPEEYKEKVMHMSIDLHGAYIMGADYAPGVAYTVEPEKSGIHLSLNFDDTGLMESCYEKLSRAGNITMAIQDTFWGERFAMVTDQYGINWMLSSRIKEKNIVDFQI